MTNTSQLDLGLADAADSIADVPAAEAPDMPWEFPVAAHQRLLEQLNQEISSGSAVPLVEGPAKSGKTRLANLFCRHCDPRFGAHLLTIAWGVGPRDVLRASATALGLPTDEGQSANQLLAILRDFARSLQDQSQTALLVFDDAHNLDARTTAALMSLVHRKGGLSNGLKLLFWSEPGLLNRVDDLQLELSVREFTLPLLTPTETGAFLEQWLREDADHAAGRFPLAPSDVQQLWVESGGCIGLVKELARERLEQRETMPKPESKSSNRLLTANLGGLPVGHIAALLLLIGGLGGLLWLGKAEPRAQATVVATEMGTPTNTTSDILVMGRGPESLGNPANTAPSAAVAPDQVPSAAEPEVVVTTATLDLEPVVDNEELRQALYGGSTPTEESASQRQSEPEKPELDFKPNPESRAQMPADPLSSDEQALLAFSPDTYSLQIMSASGRESIEQFKREQPNESRLYLYQSRRNGKPWFVLLAGNYPTRAAARAAIAELPETQQFTGPWPRELEMIQREITADRDL